MKAKTFQFSNKGQGSNLESPELGMVNRYLTAKEAAQYLNVSRRTIQRIVDAGKCKAYQDGRLLRFKREDLDQYMEVYCVPAYAMENKLKSNPFKLVS
ncbi:helix-turn-helix domain-containing protein [bacterium]|nr:helix-turn-helix domain-containing protein [bacterium]